MSIYGSPSFHFQVRIPVGVHDANAMYRVVFAGILDSSNTANNSMQDPPATGDGQPIALGAAGAAPDHPPGANEGALETATGAVDVPVVVYHTNIIWVYVLSSS